MPAFIALIVLIILGIVTKHSQNKRKREMEEYIENSKDKEDKRKQNNWDVLRDERICKVMNYFGFVVNIETVVFLYWSENGKELLYEKMNIDVPDKCMQVDIEDKSKKEYKAIKSVKSILITLYEIVDPEIEKYKNLLDETRKAINITSNSEYNQKYSELLERYEKKLLKAANKIMNIEKKCKKYIKEVFVEQELSYIETKIQVNVVDNNILFDSMLKDIDNEWTDYLSYKEAYEELSKELRR